MNNDPATTGSEEISPRDAWQMLQEDPCAQLVDVRTEPEWTYVGIPPVLRRSVNASGLRSVLAKSPPITR